MSFFPLPYSLGLMMYYEMGTGGTFRIMIKNIFVVVATALLASPTAFSAESTKSIETLLHESESAVLNSDKLLDESARPRPRKMIIARPKDPPPIPQSLSKAEATPQLTPIDTTAIQNVIAVDTQAIQREREPVYPGSVISVSGGLHNLKPVYSLLNDDDYFTDTSGGQLAGLYLSFSPTWKINFLETKVLRTFVSAVVGAGYSQGNVVMKRTGIHPSNLSYSIKLFPVRVGLQVTAELWKLLNVFGGYGPGAEVFHQDGSGVKDTMTQVFFGDEIWLGLGANVSPSIQLFLSGEFKGLGLLVHSAAFGGQIITAGVAFGPLE